jgi:CDP-diacylglycerol--serine O-phosphatidyltransferase
MAERKRRRNSEARSGTVSNDARRRHLRNGLSILPSLFTVGNIFCAYFSVMSTLNGKWDQAALAIGVGYILDGLDGRVARLTGTSTEFGAQLDSLADVLTFGIAPAILAFAWGVGGGSNGPVATAAVLDPFEQHVRSGGWLMTFGFVICGALRLARFNVQAQKPVDSTSKRYFVGLPIPAGAGLIASIVHYSKDPITNVGTSLAWVLLIGLTAFLMISTVRYHNFKELGIVSRRPRVALVIAAMTIALIFKYSEEMLLLLAVVYVSSGPVAKLVQVARRMPLSATAPREPQPMEVRREP